MYIFIISAVRANVALNKNAYQSTTYGGGTPGRAVDGIANSNWGGGSCTHTKLDSEVSPWWYVDLGDDYVISDVWILNRGDCCGKIKNFKSSRSNDK